MRQGKIVQPVRLPIKNRSFDSNRKLEDLSDISKEPGDIAIPEYVPKCSYSDA